MAVASRTNIQRIRALAIAIIFFALLSIASFTVSTVNLIRLRSQTDELKKLAEAAASQATEAKRIGDALIESQEITKQIALDAKRAADATEDCTTPEGVCFKEQQARDEAVVKGVVGGVSAANRRLITRDVTKKVEETTQTQGEATRAVVEEKSEQVKNVVVDNPASTGPVCLLPIGGLGLICQTVPQP